MNRLRVQRREISKDLSPFSYRDQEMTIRQLSGHRFSPGSVLAVARRCRWGNPQVLLCSPLIGSRPFPTLFWLTCPWLSARCGRLESQGGVKELEKVLSDAWGSWRLYQAEYALYRLSLIPAAQRRFLANHRPRFWQTLRRSGVGGIQPGFTPTVKCLHLQLGTWLALGHHPGEEWLGDKLEGQFSCSDHHCQRFR